MVAVQRRKAPRIVTADLIDRVMARWAKHRLEADPYAAQNQLSDYVWRSRIEGRFLIIEIGYYSCSQRVLATYRYDPDTDRLTYRKAVAP